MVDSTMLPVHHADAGVSLDQQAIEVNDAQQNMELEKQKKRTNIVTVIVFGAILASYGFQGWVFGWNYGNVLIAISAVSGAVVATTTAVKQIIMQRIDTLRVVHNKIRQEVNRFMEENNNLTRNVDGLEDKTIKLQEVTKQLDQIAEKQGASAQELVTLVKENAETIKEQKVSL